MNARSRHGVFIETLVTLVFIFLSTRPLFGLDPTQPLNQLYHSSWTAKDGLRGLVSSLAQTSDGFLWIGTTEGLFRFDGILFEEYKPEVGSFPSTFVLSLCAAQDGLWIGYWSGGVSFLKNGRVKNYSDRDGLPVSKVHSIVIDHDGTVWVGAVGGIARLEGEHWSKVRLNWNFTVRTSGNLLVDKKGTLWAASGSRILYLTKGSRRFEDTGVQEGRIADMTAAPDGSLWYSDSSHISILHREPDGSIITRKILSNGPWGVLLDSDGSLWLLRDKLGRIVHPERLIDMGIMPPEQLMEEFTYQDGMTSRHPNIMMEDREGNIWIGTDRGLDRLRRRNLWWYRAPEPYQYFSLMLGDDNDIWAASTTGPVLRVLTGKPIPGLPSNVGFVYRGPSGAIWVRSRDGLWAWTEGHFVKQPVPKEVDEILPVSDRDPMGIGSITTDHAGRLWVSVGGRGQFYVEGGRWHYVLIRKEHPDWAANAALADHEDRIWLANDAYLAVYKDGITQRYDGNDGPNVGPIKAIEEVGDLVLIGGELGLSVFHDGRFHSIHMSDGNGFGLVTSILNTPKDGVWLAATAGIVRIPSEEIAMAAERQGYRAKTDLLDLVSDLPDPLQRGLPTGGAVRGIDGALWFPTIFGFVRVNPRLYHNPLKPPVVIRSMIADNHAYSTYSDATLPPLTRSIRFDYTALSLAIPERIKFRYKLEGFDPEWRDVGVIRQANYDNLKPGRYRFRVIASNNDGVWNETGTSLGFRIQPAWYQTSWFLAGVVALIMLAVWCAHRFRLQQMARAMSTRFDERLAERTRIARELHDTLLQTIQATKMVSEEALEKRDDPDGMHHAIERIFEWLTQAVREGRAALNSLRSSSTLKNDLADGFRAAIQEVVPASMKAEAVVIGEVKEMHPILRDEIYRIGYEAIRNAALHSSASRLLVELQYGKDLTVRISDNGVGISSEIASQGKPGHFGLVGMRERAQKIGATIHMASTPGSGTTVMLHVPGYLIYIA